MAEALDSSALSRWRADPVSFIQRVLINPETNKPFELFDAERQFLAHAWRTDDTGRLLHPEQLFGAPKKTGKTGIAAMHLLTTTILFGGRFAEGYALANDLEQAQGRVFQAARRICEASPLLARECHITQSRIEFPETGAVIQAIGSDYASAAGANPVISSFDELWAYTSERSRRLWDEMVPSPVRKISCRLVTTYAGFEGESSLLEELYKRGLLQQQIGPSLYAGDGLLMAWHHEPCAPWQTEAWLAEMRRSLRPNQYLRMIENRFVTAESSFIELAAWDRCVRLELGAVPSNPSLPVWVGVDASVRHDSSAIVAVTYKDDVVRLVFHRIFTPSPNDPINFADSIEATLLDLQKRFSVRKVLFDPYQMVATAQRLAKAGVKVEEFPQTASNLTAASQQLFELIQGQALICYPSEAMRLAASRCIAIESSRGWRITKEKQSHKIDVIVALAMAAFAAVQGQNESSYDTTYRAFDPNYRDPDAPPPTPGWKLAGFKSREEAETFKARYRAQYGQTAQFAWDFG
jgi:phage terminase large subunit-like protein